MKHQKCALSHIGRVNLTVLIWLCYLSTNLVLFAGWAKASIFHAHTHDKTLLYTFIASQIFVRANLQLCLKKFQKREHFHCAFLSRWGICVFFLTHFGFVLADTSKMVFCVHVCLDWCNNSVNKSSSSSSKNNNNSSWQKQLPIY